jgi:hypothetical protein
MEDFNDIGQVTDHGLIVENQYIIIKVNEPVADRKEKENYRNQEDNQVGVRDERSGT